MRPDGHSILVATLWLTDSNGAAAPSARWSAPAGTALDIRQIDALELIAPSPSTGLDVRLDNVAANGLKPPLNGTSSFGRATRVARPFLCARNRQPSYPEPQCSRTRVMSASTV
jgi:hypothetical protein